MKAGVVFLILKTATKTSRKHCQEPVPYNGTGLPSGYGKVTLDYRTDLS
jgi:hypothetical protein